jgi:CheY-like chemotaxis protein
MLNLCINARDAMPSGGKLLIKTDQVTLDEDACHGAANGKPGRYVRLTASDTGCGIAPESLGQIFEPFYTTKDVGQGTGLGLSVVHGVVQQHGGMIHVESEPGRGTTFEIYLPVQEAVAESSCQQSRDSVAGGTETILLAEDEPLVRDVVARVLAEAGYKVLVALDGSDAVRTFAQNAASVELVLTDLIMPKMGGREVQQHIHEIRPDVPVIYCTGYDSDADTPESLEAEAVLRKPIAPHDLLAAVRETLDGRVPCLVS